MQRLWVFLLWVFFVSLPAVDSFAAPGQGGRRCARIQRTAVPPKSVKMTPANQIPVEQAAADQAVELDLEKRVAALEKQMADLERQQTRRGVRVRFGFEGGWDD